MGGAGLRFINRWSYGCARYLAGQLGENHEKRHVYYYAFQIIIGSLLKGILLVGLAYALGVLPALLLIFLFYGPLRAAAGGYHMDTYTRCMITSFALFLAAALAVRYLHPLLPPIFQILLACAIFPPALLTVFRYAPAGTPNKPDPTPEKALRLKRLSMAYVIFWLPLTLLLSALGYRMASLASCIGMLIGMLMISPAGYRFFDLIGGKRRVY